jgi:hypothetical protein
MVPLLAFVATVAVLLLQFAGIEPLWRIDPVTMSEAAALRDGATVIRLIRDGGDPNAPAAVRAEIVAQKPLLLTPLEAAIRERREEVVEILLEHGAMHPRGADALRCLAAAVGADGVAALLDQRYGTEPSTIDCRTVPIPWEPGRAVPAPEIERP